MTTNERMSQSDIAEGMRAARAQLPQVGARPRVVPSGPFWRSIVELLDEPAIPNWLVRGYLEAGNLAVLFGDGGTKKTFLALDLALSIASGRSWHGHDVVQRGLVIYIAGEGKAGLPKRAKAWLDHHEVLRDDCASVIIAERQVQILDPVSMEVLETEIESMSGQHGEPLLVVVDTLSRCFGPGDENSTSDMTEFVAGLDRLRDRFGCAVLVLHHTGLQERTRARGSNVLRNAADFEYRISEEQGMLVLTCKKAKDHEQSAPLRLETRIVRTGQRDPITGEESTSLVLTRATGGCGSGQGRPADNGLRTQNSTGPVLMSERVSGGCQTRLSQAQGIALRALERVCAVTGSADVKTWRREAYSLGVSSTNSAGARQRAFDRARKELVKRGLAVRTAEANCYGVASRPSPAPDNGRTDMVLQ